MNNSQFLVRLRRVKTGKTKGVWTRRAWRCFGTVRSGPAGLAILTAGLLLACTDDFPTEPDALIAQIRGISGPNVIAITDSKTLRVEIEDERGAGVTGLAADWAVRDSSVLDIQESPPPEGGSRADSLMAQLNATVTAHKSGSTFVLASVSHVGFAPATDSLLVTVVPLRIEKIGSWPEQLFVQNTVTLELDLINTENMSLTERNVDWSASDNLRITQLDETRVEVETLARGVGVIIATVREEGFEEVTFTEAITVMERWISVTAGAEHSCGITIKNDLYCWGNAQLGNGSVSGSPVPVRVLGGLKFSSVSAGVGHTCGILLDSRVFCWGRNRFGAVGNGAQADQLTPTPIELGRTFVSLASGEEEYSCGVTTDNNGFCWGRNDSYQLGDAALDLKGHPFPLFETCEVTGSVECSLVPRPVRTGDLRVDDGLDTLALAALSAGSIHTCALTLAGNPICWGSGSATLGQDTFAQTREPIPIANSVTLVSLSAGATHNCGLTSAGQAYCWGSNSLGQLGNPAAGTRSTTPVHVSGNHQFRELEASWRNSCGIKADSTAFCWGSNVFGQLAIPPGSFRGAPDQLTVQEATKFLSISVGDRHGCAVTPEGAAYCWGISEGGRIGNRSVPANGSAVLPLRVSEPDDNAASLSGDASPPT